MVINVTAVPDASKCAILSFFKQPPFPKGPKLPASAYADLHFNRAGTNPATWHSRRKDSDFRRAPARKYWGIGVWGGAIKGGGLIFASLYLDLSGFIFIYMELPGFILNFMDLY